MLFGAGCVAPGSSRVVVYWSTLNPVGIHAEDNIQKAGPFHFAMYPRVGFLIAPQYHGDDTPWLDYTDDTRSRLADIMGYKAENLTLNDYAKCRDGAVSERMGLNYAVRNDGKNGEKAGLYAGNKWADRDKTLSEMLRLSENIYDGLFVGSKTKANGNVSIEVVSVVYNIGDTPAVEEVSVYLASSSYSTGRAQPKVSFTMVPEKTVRKLMVPGTEREVPGGREADVETPRGKVTVFQPYSRYWLQNQEDRLICQAVVKLLNELPEDCLQEIIGNEKE